VEGEAGWQMYLPVTSPKFGPEGAELVVRSTLPAGTLAKSVMATVRLIDPGQPATEFRPVPAAGGSCNVAAEVLCAAGGDFCGAGIAAGFAGNLWGDCVSVMQRTQEIGIRMALGASRGRVQRGVLGKTLGLVLAGLVVGTLDRWWRRG